MIFCSNTFHFLFTFPTRFPLYLFSPSLFFKPEQKKDAVTIGAEFTVCTSFHLNLFTFSLSLLNSVPPKSIQKCHNQQILLFPEIGF